MTNIDNIILNRIQAKSLQEALNRPSVEIEVKPACVPDEFFDLLSERLGECDGTLRITEQVLKEMGLDISLEWFRNRGGYCDCEVLWNVE